MNSFREPGVVGSQFGPALGAADVQHEGPVRLRDDVAAREVRLRCVAEGLVQVGVVGPVVHVLLRAGTLHGDVEEAGRALAAGDAVHRGPVDPRLQVHEVGVVAAELAGRGAERVDGRVARVLGLEREVVRLPEVLGQVPERVGALQPDWPGWCP